MQAVDAAVKPFTVDPHRVDPCSVAFARVEESGDVTGFRLCDETSVARALVRTRCGKEAVRRYCLGHLADAIRHDLVCTEHPTDDADTASVVKLDTGSES
jgi:hypothetical protein